MIISKRLIRFSFFYQFRSLSVLFHSFDQKKMEESDADHRQQESVPPPPPPFSSSSPSSSSSSAEENGTGQDQEEAQRLTSILSYRVNVSTSDVTSNRPANDAWSCLVVLVTFWSFG